MLQRAGLLAALNVVMMAVCGCGLDYSGLNDHKTPSLGNPCDRTGDTFCSGRTLIWCINGTWETKPCGANDPFPCGSCD
jgi:hypothetical protein